MAPGNRTKVDKEDRIASILDFASRLQERLDSSASDPAIARELLQQVARPFPIPPASRVADLDELGRGLWNASIQLQQPNLQLPLFSSRLRAFAFFLLDIAHQAFAKNGIPSNDNLIRVLRVSLKAGRTCVNDNDLDLAGRIFERAAVYVETRDKEHGPMNDPEDGDEQVIKQLTSEYFLLRATLSWRSDRLDLVNHWLSVMSIHSGHNVSVQLNEKRADFLYEIGKAAFKKKEFEDAVEWLERGLATIEGIDRSESTPDIDELHLAAMSDLARALVGIGSAQSLRKASELITRMGHQYPEFRMSISLLRLDCLFTQEPADVEQVYNVIIRIIDAVHMIDNNIQTVLYHIHRLKKANEEEKKPNKHSLSYACQALEHLLPRLYELGNQSWIEKIIVTRVWLGVLERPTLASVRKLEVLFQETFSTTGKPFVPEATHAAQSLLWKLIDAPPGVHQEGGPEIWCRLACHALFQNAGDLNKSKLSRKMMLSALASGDTKTAREAYYTMPESGRIAPVTNYIMYKVALRDGDTELASNSFRAVLKASSVDTTFLYACTLEAQQNGDRQQAIAALQSVLEYYNHSTPTGIYLPALLRATAKMIIVEIEAGSMEKQTALMDVCKVFEGAMSQAKRFWTSESGEPNDHYRAELKWFASNSYNLTVTHMTDIHPELIVRFMTICISFVDMLRLEEAENLGLTHRLLLCRFLAASALVVLGRMEDNVERALAYYLDTRRQIEAFQKCLADLVHEEEGQSDQSDTRAGLIVKDFELLKYDLEALLKLQHWHDLDRVLGLCLAQQHSARWGTIADLMIHIHTQITNENLDSHYQTSVLATKLDSLVMIADLSTELPLVIEKIINASWKENGKDVRHFARWTRCLYQMTLNMNPTMALQCVKTARVIALGALLDRAPRYPRDELAWLSTSAFNHAIDTFCAGDQENGRSWAENALNLAMVADKNAALHSSLQAKWLGLQAKVSKDFVE